MLCIVHVKMRSRVVWKNDSLTDEAIPDLGDLGM